MSQQHTQHFEDLLDQATEWHVKLRSPDAGHDLHVAFSNWLNQSSEHQEAFDQIQALWGDLEAVKYIPELEQELDASLEKKAFSHYWLSFASAAMLLVAITVMYVQYNDSQYHYSEQFRTLVGQQQTVELPDGSVVQLNTDTVLHVEFDKHQRLLSLEHGEAFFDVAKDASKPFSVDVGMGSVTAIGTAFNINRRSDDVDVTVTEGIVKVSEHPTRLKPMPSSEQIHATQAVVLSHYGIATKDNAAIASAIAWQQNLIIAEDMSLAAILAELDRYSKETFHIDDQDVASLRVSGTFSTENPDAMLEALLLSFDLTHSVNVNGVTVIAK